MCAARAIVATALALSTTVFAHAQPPLRLEDVRYIIVTGAVADRVLAAREDYPVETRFYESLKRLKRVFEGETERSKSVEPFISSSSSSRSLAVSRMV